ncbi:hypothetical protein CGLO_16339 [Colletotrichum gloeosporioides Cg-14]|uniref:Uncharacterized protein n=1 Tax=Colletotrichum gloeosporioides (strain Cg-14) TaxID=1237896 RepID=T0JNU9_COLGC|nr:hypothetical protein CGLO_16339 [Colletotrichum gloeosporioides Cg-14]
MKPEVKYPLRAFTMCHAPMDNFGHDVMVVSTYVTLANVRMQPDLIVATEDGTYNDTDAIDFKPIDDWATGPLRNHLTLVSFSRLRVPEQLLVILGGRCKSH